MPKGKRNADAKVRRPLIHDVIRVKWSPDDERFISYSAGDDYSTISRTSGYKSTTTL
jgi:hypothetical protein